MKRTILTVGLLAVVLLAAEADATLIDRGNGLVYDDVNNISWTKDADISGNNNWANQNSFAANLVVGVFSDFRLASIAELVSLYGQLPGAFGSNKTGAQGPFVDIQSDYWSGTEFDANNARDFNFDNGDQDIDNKDNNNYGWAVRPG